MAGSTRVDLSLPLCILVVLGCHVEAVSRTLEAQDPVLTLLFAAAPSYGGVTRAAGFCRVDWCVEGNGMSVLPADSYPWLQLILYLPGI